MSKPLQDLEDDLGRERAALRELAFKAGQQYGVIHGMLEQADLAISKASSAGYDPIGRTMKLVLPLMRERKKYLIDEMARWSAIMSYIESRDAELRAILGIEVPDGEGEQVESGGEQVRGNGGADSGLGTDAALPAESCPSDGLERSESGMERRVGDEGKGDDPESFGGTDED